MHNFSSEILAHIQSAGLEFPGLDERTILDKVIPVAQEWVMMQIVTNHLSVDDQALFRDSYISAPDIFDPVEFLSDILPNLEELTQQYFQIWLKDFQAKL